MLLHMCERLKALHSSPFPGLETTVTVNYDVQLRSSLQWSVASAPRYTQNFIQRIEIGSYIKEIIRRKLN